MEGGDVFRAMILADAAFVFAKRHVELPVQGVFNAPVAADSCREAFHQRRKAQDKVANVGYLAALAEGDVDGLADAR